MSTYSLVSLSRVSGIDLGDGLVNSAKRILTQERPADREFLRSTHVTNPRLEKYKVGSFSFDGEKVPARQN